MTVDSKQDVFAALQAHERELLAIGVRRLGLFGSFVRNSQGASSDVDLLVEFVPARKNFDNFMQLCFLVDQLLGRRVEVITTEALTPFATSYVLREVEYVPLGH